MDHPFIASDARRAGKITQFQLASDYKQIYRDVYVAKAAATTPVLLAEAAWLFGRGAAILSGMSAAALFGTKWISNDEKSELIWPSSSRHPNKKIRIRYDRLLPGEFQRHRGRMLTTPARTAFDLGRRLQNDTAIVALDALFNATALSCHAVLPIIDAHPGTRGIIGLRRVLDLVDAGSQSPQETRTRLVLINNGLPRPSTQVTVRNSSNKFVARCDMGWKEWRVAIEYDGVEHWTNKAQRTNDIERYELLREIGWTIIRVNAEQLEFRPQLIADRAKAALRNAGAKI